MENSPNNRSSQNELDLGLNQEESLDKRQPKSENSILDKVTGLFNKKTSQQNHFATRREPTFGSINSSTKIEANSEIRNEEKVEQMEILDNETELESDNPQDNTENEKEVIAADTTSKVGRKKIEDWAILQKLPAKHRRLFIAIVAAVFVLLALLWLKPSQQTVEEIQANSTNNMPIEFQSLDPNKPLPNTENTESVTNQKENQQQLDELVQNLSTAENNAEPVQSEVTETPTIPVANPQIEQINAENARLIEQAKLAAKKAQEQTKVASEKQIEQAKLAAEKTKLEQIRIAEKNKELQQQKVEKKVKPTTKAPVVEAKPATKTKQVNSNTTTKTLTVPAGTSLFQVFRTNGLDIRDANAMTKATGAKNVLSSFKANDKIQVSVNKQGQVSSLRLSNGATFTRQTDGSYKYSR